MKNRSTAHERSFFSVIDPLYSSIRLVPPPDIRKNTPPWLYGEGEFESRKLEQLRGEMKAAELNVLYPGEFHCAAERVRFRRPCPGGGRITLRASGEIAVTVDGREIFRAADSASPHEISLPADQAEAAWLLVELSAPGGLPALLPEEETEKWEWSADGTEWQRPAEFPQTLSGVPPHLAESAPVELFPRDRKEDGLLDFGLELFGRVRILCDREPRLAVGESPEEARNENAAFHEQSTEVVAAGDGVWISRHLLAFRYLRVEPAAEASCLAEFYPVCYHGAFACSEPRLTRIWSHSAYTLRLCMKDFLLDGIKRDRLPWVGDLMVSMMANAHTFADAGIVRRTLTVLGRAGIARSHLNGIIDYSLWWVISHHHFQLYFGDRAYLGREWRRIEALMTRLEAGCDARGLLVPADGDWLFIDWVPGEKHTALQMLWHWALTSAAALAERQGETAAAENWRTRAASIKTLLRKQLQGEVASRHALFLGVLSGVAEPERYPVIRAALLGEELPPVGTPYMAGFESLALAKLGAVPEMLTRVNCYWGGMLDRGATTFWEAYDPKERGAESLAFYGRPFGRSLCHAWSAGPAAFLPAGILGLEPLADGWTRFRLNPDLRSLEWVAATIPTPRGDIRITVEQRTMSLQLPPGTVAEYRGGEFRGRTDIPLKSEPILQGAES